MQQHAHNRGWAGYEKLTFWFVFAYVLCFLSCFSFPHSLIPDVGKYTGAFWQPLVTWFAHHVLHRATPHDLSLHSDSTGMYAAAGMMLIVAALLAILWMLVDSRRPNYHKHYYWFRVFISYYLAMQLMMYGTNKIFKAQFYLPEPNTLYTTLGNIPRDLLYWSTMGISRPYSIFLGSIEIVCAALLLFRRTRTAGAVLTVFVLANIVAINFCFDISVKLYSVFLLMLAIILLWPYAIGRLRNHTAVPWQPVCASQQRRRIYACIRISVITLICTDSLWAFVRSNTYNDDTTARPYLHGAYHVTHFICNNDTLPLLETDAIRWRRIFIHRRGYLIAQHMNDRMQDYTLTCDTANKYLMIADVHEQPQGLFQYSLPNDTTLILHGDIGPDSVDIYLRKLDERILPLYSAPFHWRSDE